MFSNKKIKTYIVSFFVAVIVVVGLFYADSAKAACTFSGTGAWGKNPAVVDLNESVAFTAPGNQECANKSVLIEFYGKSGFDFRIRTMAVRANSAGISTGTISFNASDFSGRSGNQTVYYKAKAEDGSSNELTSQNLTVKLLPPGNGGDVKFDVQPRAPSSPSQSVNFTVRATLNKTELVNCGSRDVRWAVIQKTPDNVKLFFQQGVIRASEVTAGTFAKDLSFQKQIQASRFSNLIFYAELWCDKTFGPSPVAKSSDIPVTISYSSESGGQNPTAYACLASDGKYACSKGNKSDLSDVPNNACAGKTVLQIARGLCGLSGSGTCNNNGICDAGENSFGCSRDCPVTPGQTQTFPFSIPNPLQANNIVELINVIATWLFMIAIPIAVVMIVYAGIIFLTSRGEPAKVTQAKNILLYAVVGLAIIMIGKGFITLIESILNLGTGS